ncbi:M48 family metallopeptidase [candidate division WOR-3 bacterium]|nr:M48 family metallopeptidase [candidate division WOR-3 bacterium]
MIHPLLDKEKQEKAKKYEKEKRNLGLVGLFLSLVVPISFYFSGLSSSIAHWKIFSSALWIFPVFIVIYFLLQDIIGLPVSYHSGFTLEHKYGFSRQTRKKWFIDHIKGFILSIVLGIIVLATLFILFERFPMVWWLIAGGVMAFFSMILSTIFPVLIMPIFHHYDPIEDEELKNSLSDILKEAGISIEGFYREDTSKKTTKENAMLAGMGKTKRVILTDNIIEKMDLSEVRVILGHEIGHYKNKHMMKFIFIGAFLQIFAFFLLNKIMIILFPGFLAGFLENLTLLPMMLFYLGLIDLFLLKMLQNWISRAFEKEADREALKLTKDSEGFKRAMAGLANRNLSNAYPSLWVKLFYYNHPPIGERLELAENWEGN